MNSMLIPEKKTIEEFDTAVKPLYRSRFINSEQVALLCQVRDTLLPKLMSGEIRVPVEEVLEVV
jgi:type I restriction enzyme S subunit